MAVSSYLQTYDNTNASTAYGWMHALSAFMATAGWVQTADTGQVVWPVSIVNLVSVVANGSTAVWTYTLLNGAALRVGNSIHMTGATTAGLNTTAIITALGTGTFTVATATTVTETEAGGHAYAGVDPQVTITNAIGNGGTNTYTYTLLDGPAPINGQSIVITGCTTSGFNGTLTIASVNTGATTFTTTTGFSHASESETGVGIVSSVAAVSSAVATTTSLPPTSAGTLYEVWGMGDTLQSTAPVYLRFWFGTSSNAATNPLLAVGISRAMNGTGGIAIGAGPMNLNQPGGANQQTSLSQNFLSGSTNRMTWALNLSQSNINIRAFFTIERSHNTSGADTNEYITFVTMQGPNSGGPVITQQSWNMTIGTQSETRVAALATHNTGTSSFGASTLICPVFPLVGAIGNPMTTLLMAKSADWSDQAPFTFSMYGTSHTYQVSNANWGAAGWLIYDTIPTMCLIYRYD